jgi:hypothetical protein
MIELKFTPAQGDWLEVTWLDDGKEVKHVSYHPTQLALLQADAALMGTPFDDHTAMLNKWVDDYVPPPPPQPVIPQSVTMRQARLALLAINKLSAVDAAIASIEPVEQRQAIQIEWEYAATVDRDSPWVAGIAPALGLSDADIDALFVFAAGQ